MRLRLLGRVLVCASSFTKVRDNLLKGSIHGYGMLCVITNLLHDLLRGVVAVSLVMETNDLPNSSRSIVRCHFKAKIDGFFEKDVDVRAVGKRNAFREVLARFD